jgi:hypothetical protein
VQLEHRATEQDSAEWEVDIDHTVTPQYNGSDTILIMATVTGTSFRQYAVETHTKYAKNIPGTHFCQRLSRPQGHSAAGRIRLIEKKSNDLFGIQSLDLPACSSASNNYATVCPGIYKYNLENQ